MLHYSVIYIITHVSYITYSMWMCAYYNLADWIAKPKRYGFNFLGSTDNREFWSWLIIQNSKNYVTISVHYSRLSMYIISRNTYIIHHSSCTLLNSMHTLFTIWTVRTLFTIWTVHYYTLRVHTLAHME